MTKHGRPATCDCGECPKCKHRLRARAWYQKQSREKKQAIVAARDKKNSRAADKARYDRSPERRAYLNDRTKQWAKDHPAERKAQVAVSNAVRDGRLEKQPCELLSDECSGRIEAHHDDYSKPLEVRWLCSSHHSLWHAKHGSAVGASK